MPLQNCSSSWLSKSKEKRFLNVVFFAFWLLSKWCLQLFILSCKKYLAVGESSKTLSKTQAFDFLKMLNK